MNLELLVQQLHDRACAWLVDDGHLDIPAPTFFCYTPGESQKEHAFPMAAYGKTEIIRVAWIRFCRLAVALLEADTYAVQHSVWLVERLLKPGGPTPDTYAEAGGMPRDAPDRKECLFTLVRTREGGRAVRSGDMIRDGAGTVVEVKPRDIHGMEFGGTWDGLFEPAADEDVERIVQTVARLGAGEGVERAAMAELLYEAMLKAASSGDPPRADA